MSKKCRICDVSLVIGLNYTEGDEKRSRYMCKSCNTTHRREYNKERYIKNIEDVQEKTKEYYDKVGRELHGHLPMSENKTCSSYLGVHVAERMLSKVFKNTIRMPYGHKGYDFICNKGMKIDVKSAVIGRRGRWEFKLKKNSIADYFLILTFDNRKDLNPLHMWLIPGNKVNHLESIATSQNNIHKWDEYKLDMINVIDCCDIMNGDE